MIASFAIAAIPFDIILFDSHSIFALGMFDQGETIPGHLKFPFPDFKMGKNTIL